VEDDSRALPRRSQPPTGRDLAVSCQLASRRLANDRPSASSAFARAPVGSVAADPDTIRTSPHARGDPPGRGCVPGPRHPAGPRGGVQPVRRSSSNKDSPGPGDAAGDSTPKAPYQGLLAPLHPGGAPEEGPPQRPQGSQRKPDDPGRAVRHGPRGRSGGGSRRAPAPIEGAPIPVSVSACSPISAVVPPPGAPAGGSSLAALAPASASAVVPLPGAPAGAAVGPSPRSLE
jgi:hypothetical protein